MGFFPSTAETIAYLRFSGRSDEQVQLVGRNCKAQGSTHRGLAEPRSPTAELDLRRRALVAGPKRPQDRVPLTDAKSAWPQGTRRHAGAHLSGADKSRSIASSPRRPRLGSTGRLPPVTRPTASLRSQARRCHRAITSCTNTSTDVMLAAGLSQEGQSSAASTEPW